MGCLTDLWETVFGSFDSNKVSSDQESRNMQKAGVDLKYLMNDPTTPKLVKQMKMSSGGIHSPPYTIKGFQPTSHLKMGTSEWRAAQVKQTFLYTMQVMQPAFNSPIKRWPRTRQLVVIPEAGMDLNAYYDGRSLRQWY